MSPKKGTDQPIDGIDVLSHAEIDDVVNYMRMGMQDRVAARKRRAMVTSPHWWDDKMLVTGKYEKDEFSGAGHGSHRGPIRWSGWVGPTNMGFSKNGCR